MTYVGAVIDELSRERQVACVAFAGFSQGVAMAFRAAANSKRRVAGVVALGGDIPPELDGRELGNVRAALLGRGRADEWYGASTLATDVERLRAAGVRVEVLEFDAGHDWTGDFSQAAGRFLTERR
jgi:predicted esterase